MSIQFFVAEQGCGAAPTDNLGTGWGPRGDSGSERDRVRASQPGSQSPVLNTAMFHSSWLLSMMMQP